MTDLACSDRLLHDIALAALMWGAVVLIAGFALDARRRHWRREAMTYQSLHGDAWATLDAEARRSAPQFANLRTESEA